MSTSSPAEGYSSHEQNNEGKQDVEKQVHETTTNNNNNNQLENHSSVFELLPQNAPIVEKQLFIQNNNLEKGDLTNETQEQDIRQNEEILIQPNSFQVQENVIEQNDAIIADSHQQQILNTDCLQNKQQIIENQLEPVVPNNDAQNDENAVHVQHVNEGQELFLQEQQQQQQQQQDIDSLVQVQYASGSQVEAMAVNAVYEQNQEAENLVHVQYVNGKQVEGGIQEQHQLVQYVNGKQVEGGIQEQHQLVQQTEIPTVDGGVQQEGENMQMTPILKEQEMVQAVAPTPQMMMDTQNMTPEQMENFLRINHAFERFLIANHNNQWSQQQDEEKLGAMLYGFFMGYTMSRQDTAGNGPSTPQTGYHLNPSDLSSASLFHPQLQPNPFSAPQSLQVNLTGGLLSSCNLMQPTPISTPTPTTPQALSPKDIKFEGVHLPFSQQLGSGSTSPPEQIWQQPAFGLSHQKRRASELGEEQYWGLQLPDMGQYGLNKAKKKVKKGGSTRGSIEDKIVAYMHALGVSRNDVLMLFDKQPWCERQKPETIFRHQQQLQRYLRAEPAWLEQWNEFSVVSKAAVLSRVANNFLRLEFVLDIRPEKRASMYQLLTRTDKQFLSKFPQYLAWKEMRDRQQQAQRIQANLNPLALGPPNIQVEPLINPQFNL